MGFRSRAAFKLLQINQKYHLLEKAKVVIDLCAAPGSWMQVCSKTMSTDSIILGFDLDPIKSIQNCKGFQCDITTAKCLDIIRREIKHLQVDVVLNDGAPNVGSDWSKDAYQQCELVLAACKLACRVLKKGGAYVTKGGWDEGLWRGWFC
jgi:AdoMet-dependent rRNA methyltransferase SPB1